MCQRPLRKGKSLQGFPKGHVNKLPLENESGENYAGQVFPGSVVTLRTLCMGTPGSLSCWKESLGCHMVDEELGDCAAYSVLLGRCKSYT